jgi:hypothetical protein
MMCAKCFGILVEREPIADIAEIGKPNLPRIEADERGSGIGLES